VDLSSVPILDHHCHSLLREPPARLEPFFTEGADPSHVPQTVFFRWAIRELAGFFDCPATIEAVQAARAALAWPELSARMLRDANVAALLIDLGYRTGQSLGLDEARRDLPCRVEPILRLETLAQDLVLRHDTLGQVLDAYVAGVEAARRDGYVALKSIVAYRTGLSIGEPSRADVSVAFAGASERARRDGRVRLAEPALNDRLVRLALEGAARLELPFQIHTGFGDADVDLLRANPLLLRPLLEDRRYSPVPFVLLHAGYPYVRELAYLAALYPNVYMDLSLAIPFAAGDVVSVVSQALGLAPTSKLLYASDAFSIPDLFWIAARWGRRAIARVLGDLVDQGALDRDEALDAARRILHDNAARLYLDGV
jgi:hypothetical protein